MLKKVIKAKMNHNKNTQTLQICAVFVYLLIPVTFRKNNFTIINLLIHLTIHFIDVQNFRE